MNHQPHLTASKHGMVRWFGAIVLFIQPLVTPNLSFGGQPEFSEIAATAKTSVVYLKVEGRHKVTKNKVTWTGSAFLVTWTGKALTAHHVISREGYDISSIKASIGSRKEDPTIAAKIIAREAAWDLALLELEKQPEMPKPLLLGDSKKVRQLTSLLVIGFPLGKELSSDISTVSSVEGEGARWQVSGAINQGESGGPVIDASGKVVAVVTGGIPPSEASQISFVTPIDRAVHLLSPFEAETQTTYEAIYAEAKRLEKDGKKKEYIEKLESLVTNERVMESFDLETRNRMLSRLHEEIALELVTSDYIEGISDLEDQAFIHLSEALDMGDQNATALTLMGYLVAWRNRTQVSEVVLNEVDNYFLRARDLAQQLDDMTAQTAAGFFLVLHWGKALYQLGKHEEAMSKFEAGLNLAALVKEHMPDYPPMEDLFYYNLGLTELARTDSIEKAASYWNKIEDSSFLSDTLVITGSKLWQEGWKAQAAGDESKGKFYFNQARKTFSEAKQRGKRTEKLHIALGILHFNTEDYTNAESNFSQAVKFRGDPQALYWLARTQFQQKKYSQARQSIESSLQGDPTNSESHYWHGRILQELGKAAEARAAYEQNIKMDSGNTEGYFYLILLLLNTAVNQEKSDTISLYEAAMSSCRNALSQGRNKGTLWDDLSPHDSIRALLSVILNALAYRYADEGHLFPVASRYVQESKAYADQLAAFTGKNRKDIDLYILDMRNWVTVREAETSTNKSNDEKQHIYQKAKQELEDALTSSMLTVPADTYYHVGYINNLLGDRDRAVHLMLKALEIDPTHQKSKEFLN